ncbi:MAG TPA: glycerophosphodiester phosphodiesterase family protein [Pararobbsia sp.]|nr:glycerophosphodiester phosphodiesterase family protein [Pararobbsia sp.]
MVFVDDLELAYRSHRSGVPVIHRRSTERLERLQARATHQPLRIAHRGARAYAPENTIEAFSKALDLGSDMVEFDVHVSRDGHPVVVHDDTLIRCSDAVKRFAGLPSYFVSDFSLAELQSLDAGRWYVDQLTLPMHERQPYLQVLKPEELARYVSDDELRQYGSGSVRIPSLAQTLAWLAERRLLANIELKTIPRLYPGIAEKVIAQIRHYGLDERVMISSFDHEQLRIVRALDARIATAVLTSDRLSALTAYLDAIDADAFHPGCYDAFDTLGFGSVERRLQLANVEEVLATGRWVNVWTCNDDAQIEALIRAGVSGIMTDYPNRLARPETFA